MRQVMALSIDQKLKSRIEKASRKYHITKSRLVKEAVEKYLALGEFENLRAELAPYGEKAGYYTDEDIYKDKSIS